MYRKRTGLPNCCLPNSRFSLNGLGFFVCFFFHFLSLPTQQSFPALFSWHWVNVAATMLTLESLTSLLQHQSSSSVFLCRWRRRPSLLSMAEMIGSPCHGNSQTWFIRVYPRFYAACLETRLAVFWGGGGVPETFAPGESSNYLCVVWTAE